MGSRALCVTTREISKMKCNVVQIVRPTFARNARRYPQREETPETRETDEPLLVPYDDSMVPVPAFTSKKGGLVNRSSMIDSFGLVYIHTIPHD